MKKDLTPPDSFPTDDIRRTMPELWDDPDYYDDTYYQKQWAINFRNNTIIFVIIIVGGGVVIAKLLGLV